MLLLQNEGFTRSSSTFERRQRGLKTLRPLTETRQSLRAVEAFLRVPSTTSTSSSTSSRFRGVGQLTVCKLSRLAREPASSRRPALPLGRRGAQVPPPSPTSPCAISINLWLAPSAVCWIPERESEREGSEPWNLCGAELEKLLLSENQTPCLLGSFDFSWRKTGLTTQARTCNEEQTWYLSRHYY